MNDNSDTQSEDEEERKFMQKNTLVKSYQQPIVPNYQAFQKSHMPNFGKSRNQGLDARPIFGTQGANTPINETLPQVINPYKTLDHSLETLDGRDTMAYTLQAPSLNIGGTTQATLFRTLDNTLGNQTLNSTLQSNIQQ